MGEVEAQLPPAHGDSTALGEKDTTAANCMVASPSVSFSRPTRDVSPAAARASEHRIYVFLERSEGTRVVEDVWGRWSYFPESGHRQCVDVEDTILITDTAFPISEEKLEAAASAPTRQETSTAVVDDDSPCEKSTNAEVEPPVNLSIRRPEERRGHDCRLFKKVDNAPCEREAEGPPTEVRFKERESQGDSHAPAKEAVKKSTEKPTKAQPHYAQMLNDHDRWLPDSLLDPGWRAFLNDYFPEWESVLCQSARLFEEKQIGGRPFPMEDCLMDAFNCCPLKQLSVVMVCNDLPMDCLWRMQHAAESDGLALSAAPQNGRWYLRQEAKQLLGKVYTDAKTGDRIMRMPSHGSLKSWARQGVLLLNGNMISGSFPRKSRRGARPPNWRSFIQGVMRALWYHHHGQLLFVLAGEDSTQWRKDLEKMEQFSHPPCESITVSNGHIVVDCRYYTPSIRALYKENQRKLRLPQIQWQIPVSAPAAALLEWMEVALQGAGIASAHVSPPPSEEPQQGHYRSIRVLRARLREDAALPPQYRGVHCEAVLSATKWLKEQLRLAQQKGAKDGRGYYVRVLDSAKSLNDMFQADGENLTIVAE